MTVLFEDYPGRRPADLAKMEGLPFKAARELPHPVEIVRWHEAGLFCHDMSSGCFRLTTAGRAVVRRTV